MRVVADARGRAFQVMALMGSLLVLPACGRAERDEPADTRRDPLEHIADSVIATLPTRPVCHPTAVLLADGRDPRVAEWQGCTSRTSQGRYFDYRDADGRVTVVGRELHSEEQRVATITDSLRRAFSLVYGNSARCPAHGSYLVDDVAHYRWDGPGYGVEIVAEVRDGATVTIEYRRGVTLCRGWVPAPIIAL